MRSDSRLRLEVGIVLGLSLGASAVYSIVSIVARVTDERPLAEQVMIGDQGHGHHDR